MLEKRIPIQVAEAVERIMKYANQGEIEKFLLQKVTVERLERMLSQIMMFRILIVLHTMVCNSSRRYKGSE